MTDTDYIKRLEEQNEQLQQMLAKEQEFVSNINKNIWVINEVYGSNTGEMYWQTDIIKDSLLEKYVFRLGARCKGGTVVNEFIGFNFTRPILFSVDDNLQLIKGRGENYWFNDKMLFIEGFVFDSTLTKWMYKDSGNSMEFNVDFTDKIHYWFERGLTSVR